MYYHIGSWTIPEAQKHELGTTHAISIRGVRVVTIVSRKLQFGIVFVSGIYSNYIGQNTRFVYTPSEHTASPLLSVKQVVDTLRPNHPPLSVREPLGFPIWTSPQMFTVAEKCV